MYLRLPADARIVGIAVSETVLEQHTTIDERIAGDIETFPLPSEGLDIVVCWDVLEHLRRPRAALDNLPRAVREGGLLVMRGPNALSFKGLVTLLTPFWAHRLWYRLRERNRRPSTYRRVATQPRVIQSWAREHFQATEYSVAYENPMEQQFRQRLGLEGPIWSAAVRSVYKLSAGLVHRTATDFILVLRR